MALSTRKLLTADEFFALPGELKHTELIDGELVVDTPSTRHQRIAGWIFYRLMRFLEDHPGAGEAGYELSSRLGERNVFVPDVWWNTPEHVLARDSRGHEGPPDLAIEVRSPTTWRKDLGVKKARYEEARLPELWLVDTEGEKVLVFRRSDPAASAFDVALEFGPGETVTTPIIPGFELDVGELFDR